MHRNLQIQIVMRGICLFILLLFALNGLSQQKERFKLSEPQETGISSKGIAQIDSLMNAYVKERKLAGMVTMVAYKGKTVQFHSYGNLNDSTPMPKDAIFRIASMTKPVTSVAIMILYDEGLLKLDDPVSKYIPQFDELKVFSHCDSAGLHLEKQKNQVTIQNLLTHTSGLASGAENSYVDSLYRVAKLNVGTLNEEIEKLVKIPLKYQPGTRWQYGLSTDVLAFIVEKVSGKPLDVFFKERIFTPLKMDDTGYSVADDKLMRVSSVYSLSGTGIQVLNIPEINQVGAPAKNIRGNGGLLSTASDYMIFTQMLLNKGKYHGTRILKKKTLELMTSNKLTNECMPDDEFFSGLMSGMGFGLGFAVVTGQKEKAKANQHAAYWWMGSANTYFYIDPDKELILVFMTQFVPNFYYPICKQFRELVYASLID